MDPQPPPPAGPSAAPWHKVVLDTFRLSRQRRREHREAHEAASRRSQADPSRDRRAGIAVLIVTAVLLSGALLAIVALTRQDDPNPGTAATPSPLRPFVDTSDLPSRPTTESSRAGPGRATTLARAAAGAQIAERTDIDVSPAAAAFLREGAVDGRVLIVLAALATEGYLTAVDASPASGGAPEMELGVVDVDVVLDWLDQQPRVRPDHLQVRRVSAVAYLRLAYDTPEPPGLFPS
ncbi:MAG: hypothetical protein ACRDVN_15395 [Jiangellaceae bacterium]